MALRRLLVVGVLATVFASMGAQHRTTNFVVNAPNQEVAQQVGQWAEYYRKAKAIEWLGHEMPNWQKPCPLYVNVSMEGPSGATSFVFHPQGGVLDMKMEIKGPLDRLLASVLPHEITHTVFAHYYRQAVPRWADEGGSVLSEDDLERERHNKIVRGILNRSQQYRLRQLFNLKDYPRQADEVMCLYAEGFSVSHYLVYLSDRPTFLRFVQVGMQRDWDTAVQSCYGLKNVEELEESWLKFLRESKGMTLVQLAQNKEKGQPTATTTSNSGTVVRLTAPPVDPLPPVPVVRGAMPDGPPPPQNRPGYLPEPLPSRTSPPPSGGWQVPAERPAAPIPVQLGTPQYPAPSQPAPQWVSPVGYPQ